MPPAPLVGCFATMVAMGLLISALGPLLPVIRGEFQIGPQLAGFLVAGNPLGCIAGTLLSMLLSHRIAARWLLVGTGLTLALGLLGAALAPAWWLLFAAFVVMGIGYGAGTNLVNGVVAVAYGSRAAGVLNLMNGVFGVGAVVGPFVVSLVGGSRLAYLPYVLVALLAAVLMWRLPSSYATAASPEPDARRVAPRPAWGRLAATAAMLGAYTATEVSASSFATTHVLATGVSVDAAVRATAMFYIGLAAGRLLVSPVASRIGSGRLMLICAALASGCLVLAWVAPLGGLTYVLVGAAMGPVFPTVLAWVSEQAFGRNALPVVLTAANVGGLILPPLIGTVIAAVGAAAAPLPMAVSVGLSAVLIAVVTSARGRVANT
ncbi:MFS transporter [Fodinicola acaciae]|uniref:MFS transporter n=1 Tax=Fodinicola acaciae TaxID=2681555 RepID=UPI0013D70CD0|nr:MFS transporter [Fodinicola acaciae]